MADILFKNVSATERVPKGTVLRFTFAQETTLLARDASFAQDFAAFYGRLNGAGVYPITPNPTLRGDTVAVLDLRVSQDNATISDMVRAVDAQTGFWIQVRSVERLTAAAAAIAPSNTGAQTREAVKAQEYKQLESESITNRIARATGAALSTVKWVAIAVIILVVIAAVFKADSIKKALR